MVCVSRSTWNKPSPYGKLLVNFPSYYAGHINTDGLNMQHPVSILVQWDNG